MSDHDTQPRKASERTRSDGDVTSASADPRLGRGRRPRALDPSAGAVARLGYAVREARIGRDLTLGELAALAGSTLQHLSAIERAKAVPNDRLVRELERVLGTDGRLLALLPDAAAEHVATREELAQARARARRAAPVAEDQ